MKEYDTLAAVDLGSNSFRLQVARVVDNQLYELDSIKESVRLAAGLTADKHLDEATQLAALACMKRFGERLRGFAPEAVRAVGTNALRVAKNAGEFLAKAEQALGFPIEVVAGREEARLIYVGVAHGQPAANERRLVVDVGGGSTECIIGEGLQPIATESLYMGCVTHTQRYFPGGKIDAQRMHNAELAASEELQTIAAQFLATGWQRAIGSSGTARAIGEILLQNGFASGGISAEGLSRLRALLIRCGDWRKLAIPGLAPDRAQVIVGGFAIMSAVFAELQIEHMALTDYALRHGVLYDLLGRVHHDDLREATVSQFMRRYHVDPAQAQRVEAVALKFYEQIAEGLPEIQRQHETQLLSWAARLHEVGISISYSGYHKHSAYIAQNADMPGFSRMEQARLGLLLLTHRGALAKFLPLVTRPEDWALILAFRLAVLFNRRRADSELPPMRFARKPDRYQLTLDEEWLERHPLTETVLEKEIAQWQAVGLELRVKRAAREVASKKT